MRISTEAKPLGNEVWLIEMAPHQVRFFGDVRNSYGDRSVVVVKNPDYDQATRQLRFDAEDATALNIGTLTHTVAIGATTSVIGQIASRPVARVTPQSSFGPGDKQFLGLVKQLLPEEMQEAALELLSGVRQRNSGDLLRGKTKNFSETPDNFWYVVVQPKVQHLQITVRGPVDHFSGLSKLELKDDRGNTRFKVTRRSDVTDALRLIFHAKRKN